MSKPAVFLNAGKEQRPPALSRYSYGAPDEQIGPHQIGICVWSASLGVMFTQYNGC